MSLAYLFDSNIQFQDRSGNNNVNGFLRVYIDNTDDRAVTYKDFNGTLNQADIRLDNNGRAVVIVDDSKTYRLEVYGTTGVLLWTLYPISPKATGINETLEALVAAVKSHTIAIEGLALGKKNKQQAKVISGTPTQTVKSISQNADGEITVEFEDIDFPYNIKINSPDDSIEVGTPVVDPERKEETIPISVKRPGLVKADSEDTEPGTLIDKLEVVDNVRDPEEPTILGLEVTTDGQGNRKVAINEDSLRTFAGNVSQAIIDIADTLDSMDFDEVPHGSFGSSLNQSPGDGTSTSIQISVFRPLETTIGEAIAWTKTTEIGGEDFGTVTLEPGTYIICSDITCQWVGAPAGIYLPQVGNVLGEPFDFSQQQELHRRMTNVVTVSTTTQFKMRISFDAATPVMGFWINSAQIVKIAGGMSQTNVAHDSTLTGQGSVADPLGVNTQNVAQSTLAGNIAPAFDPNKQYIAGNKVLYNGQLYMFVNSHNGGWLSTDAIVIPSEFDITLEGYYYTSTQTTPSRLSSASICSAVISVSEGDKLDLTLVGSATAKPYILLNEKDRILRVCDTESFSGTLTVGANETKLIVQFNRSNTWKIERNSGNSFKDSLNTLKNSVNRVYGDSGYYRDCSGDTIPSSKVQSASYSSGIVYAQVGDQFTYYGWTAGSSAAICIATFDRKGNFVRKINDNHITSPFVLTIENEEVGFVWNGLNTYSFLLKNPKSVAEDISNIQKEILDKVILDGRVSIPYINTRKTIQIWCDKCFRLHAKVKFPKSYTKNPIQSLNIGSFANVIPQIQSVVVAQHTTTYRDSWNNTVTQYWPYLSGGIKYNGVLASATRLVRLSGDIAFSIQYTGLEDDATISNDGSNIVITEGLTSHTFVLANYSTMKALYLDIAALENFACNFGSIEGKTPNDLILFGQVKLKSKFYGYTSPSAQSPEEYVDAAPFYVQYADEAWHELDVIGGLDHSNRIITAVDGIAYTWTAVHNQKDILTFDFYGHAGFNFEFKDVIIDTTSYGDAEYIDPPGGSTPPMIVSSMTPLITVFEGHAIVDALSSNALDMGCTTDRLATVLSMYRNKGYEFVTMDEILAYYNSGRPLPKRSLTACFDDYQFEDVLTIERRRALTSNGFRFNLAVITNKGDAIHYDNDTITLQQAVDMVRNLGGDCFTHTKNHTRLSRIKLSDLADVLRECIADADLKNIKSTMLVYPNGDTRGRFSENTMAMLGMDGGLEIAPGVNSAANSKYSIRRVEIGERQNMDYITSWCL